MKRSALDTFFLVVLVAAVVRLAGIGDFPPGLWSDEGLNGVDAWYTLHADNPHGPSGPRLVYPDVFPREPLLVWILSIALWLGGPRVIIMRLTMALLGSLACGIFFGAVWNSERSLGAMRDEKASPSSALPLALAAGFVLATMHWHAHFSRLVFRTNLVPLAASGAVLLMARAARTPAGTSARVRWWLAAGAVAGVGFYTYLSWYFFLPVLAVWLWALRGHDKPDTDTPRGAMRPVLYWIAGVAIVALPLALHYVAHPEHLTGRPAEVSPLRNGLGSAMWLIIRNLRDVVLMFFVRGDHVPKHNIPWSPVLGPVWGAFFVAGIVRAAHAIAKRSDGWRRAVAWLAWLVCMSMPSVLSQTDSANTLRNLGAAPAVAWFVAFGWQGLGAFARRLPHPRARWVSILLLIGLLWGAAWQVDKIWRRHPAVPDIANSFNALHVELARLVTQQSDTPVFIPTDFYTHKTFEFLTIGDAFVRPLDTKALLTPDAPPRDHRILCTALTTNYSALRERFPNMTVEREKLAMGPRPFAWVCRIPAASIAREAGKPLELTTLR